MTKSVEGRFPALLSAASNAVIMALVLLMVTTRLSAEEQGYFFTFLSFAALAQLVDFGLAYASMQTASHLGHQHKTNSLQRQALRISLLTSLVALPVIAVFGIYTLARGDVNVAILLSSWFAPWLAYTLAVLAALPITTLLAIREGYGAIAAVWRLRACQEWITGGILLACLLGGAGLWSLVLSAAFRPLIGGLWLSLTKATYHDALIVSGHPPPEILWRKDVWPFQWKIGLSFLCGFLIFRAITPMVLFERGEVVAGQIGLAISIMNMIIAFSTAWPTSQAARYGFLLAGQSYAQLKSEFRHALLWSTAVCCGTIIAACVSLQWLALLIPSISNRLPSLFVTALILGAALFHHVVISLAAPLRAERKEPLLVVSVVGSIVTILALWLAAHYAGSLAIAATNLVCAAAGFPVALYIFRNRLNAWNHS